MCKKKETIREQLARIQKWQVEVMGNTCTTCHGDNAETQCAACGWWGKVPPSRCDVDRPPTPQEANDGQHELCMAYDKHLKQNIADARRANKQIDGYSRGDPYHLTGKTETHYGGRFYIAMMLDGDRKGKTVLVSADQHNDWHQGDTI